MSTMENIRLIARTPLKICCFVIMSTRENIRLIARTPSETLFTDNHNNAHVYQSSGKLSKHPVKSILGRHAKFSPDWSTMSITSRNVTLSNSPLCHSNSLLCHTF